MKSSRGSAYKKEGLRENYSWIHQKIGQLGIICWFHSFLKFYGAGHVYLTCQVQVQVCFKVQVCSPCLFAYAKMQS